MNCIAIINARYIADFKVELTFNTGEVGNVDLRELIFASRAATPLRNPVEFSKFYLDSWPTIAWSCGFDIDPDSLYYRATGKKSAEMELV
jgi:hypothetical protein